MSRGQNNLSQLQVLFVCEPEYLCFLPLGYLADKAFTHFHRNSGLVMWEIMLVALPFFDFLGYWGRSNVYRKERDVIASQ